MIRVAIFASGTGSNARCLMQHFKDHQDILVSMVASDKPNAGVLDIATSYEVPTYTFTKQELREGNVEQDLKSKKVDFIILAGFLALIPETLVQSYLHRIINIHPSLLPNYGGKGMFGQHVHKAVKQNQENQSGMTIHLVNKEFDKGKVLFQATTTLNEEDTAEQIQKKVLVLEHQFFAGVVESYIQSV